MTLNPALEDLNFCPRCGREQPRIDFPRSLQCPGCGYGAFYNPKPVACTIPVTADEGLVLMRRATPPRGRWTMPGGFVDLGESVEEAAIRETREELNLEVQLRNLVGVYSRSDDRIVVVVYAATALNTPEPTEEALEVAAFEPTTIPWDQLAFWSDGRALRDHLKQTGAPAETAAAPS